MIRPYPCDDRWSKAPGRVHTRSSVLDLEETNLVNFNNLVQLFLEENKRSTTGNEKTGGEWVVIESNEKQDYL